VYPIHTGDIPYLTTDQMREVDRLMIEVYHIELVQMMENAGQNLAHLARERFFAGDPRGKRVAILAGAGGNGGGALVCARRLHNYGAQIQAFVAVPVEKLAAVTRHQLDIVRRMGIPVVYSEMVAESEKTDLVIDGLIGYGLKDVPRGRAANLIRWANATSAPILALDIPSGLDASSGASFDPTIRAAATMTLGLPKRGLAAPGAEAYVGELYVADICVPPELYARLLLDLNVGPLFAKSDIIRLH
jgi:NAD(P)H-hydrate epimerase